MLALQVAAGIVLAYVVIVNQRLILSSAKWLIGVVVTVAALVFVGWGASEAWSGASSYISPQLWQKFLFLLSMIPVLILAILGVVGFALLALLLVGNRGGKALDRFFKALAGGDRAEAKGENPSGIGPATAVAVFLTVMVNYAFSFPVWAYTPLGAWSDELYRYGMTNSWKDGLQIIFDLSLWQWPWIPLGIYYVVQRLRGGSAASAPE